jgi:hypothetical protein
VNKYIKLPEVIHPTSLNWKNAASVGGNRRERNGPLLRDLERGQSGTRGSEGHYLNLALSIRRRPNGAQKPVVLHAGSLMWKRAGRLVVIDLTANVHAAAIARPTDGPLFSTPHTPSVSQSRSHTPSQRLITRVCSVVMAT